MGDYELYHSGARKHHKYIKKIGKRYFYTQQEIAAYLKENKDVNVGTVTEVSEGRSKPIGIEIRSNKQTKTDKDGYFTTRYTNKKGVYAKDKKITAFSTKDGKTNEHTLDLNKAEKAVAKKKKQLHNAKEAVAEATGRRDVYWEAPKVTENGRTFYDDEASTLRTGKMDKRGKKRQYEFDGKTYTEVYTKNGTMQYHNDYTDELNAKTRKRGRKKLKKMATTPIRGLKNQSAKGKKALENYKKKRAPKVEVIQSISEDKNYKRKNGGR